MKRYQLVYGGTHKGLVEHFKASNHLAASRQARRRVDSRFQENRLIGLPYRVIAHLYQVVRIGRFDRGRTR